MGPRPSSTILAESVLSRPPLRGGRWHSECRGDVKALNEVLANFAKLDAKVKRIVVHDGEGHSFWLAPNREPAKLAAAKIDWLFMVWEPKSWGSVFDDYRPI